MFKYPLTHIFKYPIWAKDKAWGAPDLEKVHSIFLSCLSDIFLWEERATMQHESALQEHRRRRVEKNIRSKIAKECPDFASLHRFFLKWTKTCIGGPVERAVLDTFTSLYDTTSLADAEGYFDLSRFPNQQAISQNSMVVVDNETGLLSARFAVPKAGQLIARESTTLITSRIAVGSREPSFCDDPTAERRDLGTCNNPFLVNLYDQHMQTSLRCDRHFPSWLTPSVALALLFFEGKLDQRVDINSFGCLIVATPPLPLEIDAPSLNYFLGQLPAGVRCEAGLSLVQFIFQKMLSIGDGIHPENSLFVAFFPYLCRIPQSCNANVVLIPRGDTMMLVSLRPIAQGEKLCANFFAPGPMEAYPLNMGAEWECTCLNCWFWIHGLKHLPKGLFANPFGVKADEGAPTLPKDLPPRLRAIKGRHRFILPTQLDPSIKQTAVIVGQCEDVFQAVGAFALTWSTNAIPPGNLKSAWRHVSFTLDKHIELAEKCRRKHLKYHPSNQAMLSLSLLEYAFPTYPLATTLNFIWTFVVPTALASFDAVFITSVTKLMNVSNDLFDFNTALRLRTVYALLHGTNSALQLRIAQELALKSPMPCFTSPDDDCLARVLLTTVKCVRESYGESPSPLPHFLFTAVQLHLAATTLTNLFLRRWPSRLRLMADLIRAPLASDGKEDAMARLDALKERVVKEMSRLDSDLPPMIPAGAGEEAALKRALFLRRTIVAVMVSQAGRVF